MFKKCHGHFNFCNNKKIKFTRQLKSTFLFIKDESKI